MRTEAFTVGPEMTPFRPLLEQIFSRMLIQAGQLALGRLLLSLSTAEILALAINELIRTAVSPGRGG